MKQGIMKWVAAIVLAVAILLPSVWAIGVAPASSEHRGLAGNTKEYRFKALNPDGEQTWAVLSAEGELAEYITFPEEVVEFRQKEVERWVIAELEVSDELEPGQYESRILVTSAPVATGTFSARLQVVHRLSLTVEYPDYYVKADLLVPDFEVGKEDSFGLGVRNKGKYDIDANIDAGVRIPGITIAERLSSPDVSLAVNQHTSIDLPWTPEWSGDYIFEVGLSYANISRNLSEQFQIGAPLLAPEWAEYRRVALGEVLPLTMGITSNWNVPIEGVHAWVTVWKDDSLVLETRTVSEDVAPRGTVELPIYIETASLEYGTYRLEMDLLSGRTRDQYVLELTLSPDDITLTPTGFILAVREEPLFKRIGQPFAVLGLVAVLFGILFIALLVKRRKQ